MNLRFFSGLSCTFSQRQRRRRQKT
uniref:Uncharacterized protein n=1 Tax=Anguilla anguilla TaxID=7936 RepID=A0A0E9WJ91_ANGAN